MITEEIKKLVDSCVLAWMATADDHGIPNVSPKEVFAIMERDLIVVANIASPITESNIRKNPQVAISMVHIWTQQGYQFKGDGSILSRGESSFDRAALLLNEITRGLFKFDTIFSIRVSRIKAIVAPSYYMLGRNAADCITDSERSYLSILEDQKKNWE